jgi:hypothetical protein
MREKKRGPQLGPPVLLRWSMTLNGTHAPPSSEGSPGTGPQVIFLGATDPARWPIEDTLSPGPLGTVPHESEPECVLVIPRQTFVRERTISQKKDGPTCDRPAQVVLCSQFNPSTSALTDLLNGSRRFGECESALAIFQLPGRSQPIITDHDAATVSLPGLGVAPIPSLRHEPN